MKTKTKIVITFLVCVCFGLAFLVYLYFEGGTKPLEHGMPIIDTGTLSSTFANPLVFLNFNGEDTECSANELIDIINDIQEYNKNINAGKYEMFSYEGPDVDDISENKKYKIKISFNKYTGRDIKVIASEKWF